MTKLSDVYVGKRLFCGQSAIPQINLGIGPLEARGSAYFEGPTVTGLFPSPWPYAANMVGPNINLDSPFTFTPGGLYNPYSQMVLGNSGVLGNLDIGFAVTARGPIIGLDVISIIGGRRLSSCKTFDISHPSKKDYRLRHSCPEGPSNDVYIRGRLKNKKNIVLPEYWKDLVDINSITVSITPIGAPQDIFVKRIGLDKILLESSSVIPINCHYHIFAERKDVDKLIPEYEGETPADYPGNNEQYSIAGYHYDVK
tara:strand:+ start:1388 stop:2152 length:765 start_codon:yes stop_codon:yes gene_type:complete